MTRRHLLGLLVGMALGVSSVRANGQPTKGVRKIGMLDLTSSSDTETPKIFSTLLGTLGWVEGRDFIFELRNSGNSQLQRQYAEEFVHDNVSVIMTLGYGATMAAYNATKRIPIVMNVAEDPVRAGFVASLAKPGGNITGVWFNDDEVTSKRLAMVRELLPKATRVATLSSRADKTSGALRQLGFEAILIDVRSREGISTAMEEAHRRTAQAVIVPPEWIFAENWALIVQLADQYKIPLVSFEPSYVEDGALMSFSVDPEENYLTRALQVDKILRGAKPADLPVQQPSKFMLAINLQVARALGITVPRPLQLRADKVIQ